MVNKLIDAPFNHRRINNNINHTIYFQNVNKMSSKAIQFSNFILKTAFSIYVILETNFNNNILSNEFFTSDYVVYRCDRSPTTSKKKTGGGVLIAVHNMIKCEVISLASHRLEHICVKIMSKNKTIFVYAVYIPPNSSFEIYSNCVATLEEIYNISRPEDSVVVLGDFNLTDVNWSYDEDLQCMLPSSTLSDIECCFIDPSLQMNLRQLNHIPNMNGRFLDLVFSNDTIFKVSESLTPFTLNDTNHKPLEICFNTSEINESFNQHLASRTRLNFKKADTMKLRNHLININWEEEFSDSEDINTNLDTFYDKLFEGFDLFVPLTKTTTNTHKPWYDDALINLKNRKDKAYKRMRCTNTDVDKIEFIKIKNEFNSYYDLRFNAYITEVQNKIKDDPKYFWKFFSDKRETKGYPSTMQFDNSTSSKPKEIANLFASFFQSIYKSDDYLYNDQPIYNANCSIHIPTISAAEILNAIKHLGTGCGPDTIPSSVIKTLANEICYPLKLLFNKSLCTGVFPNKWKISKITPVFKSGKRSDISCYRGIATTSTIPKLFEILVCDAFKKIIPRHLSFNQHGFMPGRSTTTNLVEFTNITMKSIENHQQVDTIYTDFSKAFDSIDHKRVLMKLDTFGFSSMFVKWFHSYLMDRHQIVEIGGEKSNPIRATSGVPQGSHIGPWLFLIFIDDITKVIQNSYVLLFADDIKIFRQINNVIDAVKLQEDINRISVWCNNNQLHLNINKCKLMSFHRKAMPIIFDYTINGTLLGRITEIKDLGVTFVSCMSFSRHIDLCISKANSMFGFLRRWTIDIKDQTALFALYFAYIRCHLEYAVTVWCPYNAVHINRIEAVQKRVLLYILRKTNWNYDHNKPYHENLALLPPYLERCKNYKIATLNNRRQQISASLLGNVLLGHIDSPFILDNIKMNAPCRNLRRNSLLKLETHRTNYGENEPINMMTKFFTKIEELFDFGLSKQQFNLKLKHHFIQF